MAEQITDSDFDQVVSDSDTPVLVDFFAPWCGPCRAMSPILDELSKEYEGKVRICKMNIDENQVTAHKFQIRAVPTMVLMKNGQIVDTIQGAVSKEALKQVLAKAIA